MRGPPAPGAPPDPADPGARAFTFDRTFTFAADRERLWAAVTDLDSFPRWWRWLRRFEPDGPVAPGTTARCTVHGPTPWPLRFDVQVEEAVVGERIATVVRGDVEGPATLELVDAGGGCTAARLSWSLHLADPRLLRVARVSRPLMVWAHDRVVARGTRRFVHQALC